MSSAESHIRRLDLGYFIRPASETGDLGTPRAEAVLAYLVRHGDEVLLFDSGMGKDPDVDAHYRPHRRDLVAALRGAGVGVGDVTRVVNCHLHFDHCGGNPLFAGRPIFVQKIELDTAQGDDYTLRQLVDFDGAAYEELGGEVEILPGIWIIPTPGHTAGHQSLVIRRSDGTVILAGQAHDFASGFAAGHLARLAEHDGAVAPLPPYHPWMDKLLEFDPQRILFAHDASVWMPSR